MSSPGGQFTLLLWKNFVLQKRKLCVTIFEIIMPLFFALLLLLIRAVSDSEYISTYKRWDAFNLTTPNEPPYGKSELFYAPSNTHTDAVMNAVISDLGGTTLTLKGFSDEATLINDYSLNYTGNVWAAVIFNTDSSSGIPASLDYTLRVALRTGQEDEDRWRTDNTYAFFETFGYRDDTDYGGEPYYYDTGFLLLQYQINKQVILTHDGSAGIGTSILMQIQKILFPPHLDDVLTTVLQQQLPFFLVLSFILNALQIAKNIAYEKEKKLKEAMKMMGLSTTMYWLSWFIKCLIYLLIVAALYTAIFAIKIGDKGKILNYTQPTVFFVFLLCYILSIIAFCFMVSSFFNSANVAAFFAGILFFLTYFPIFFLSDRYQDMSLTEKMLASLLSNVAMAFGCYTIVIHEGTGDGAQWDNFYESGSISDNFTLLYAMIMLLVDTFIYMLVAWYVDNINPGDAGVAQPFWFPFLPSYWCGSGKQSSDDVEATGEVTGDDSRLFERDPKDASIGISIRHLRKEFKSKVAVKDTSLNMFEGQITALLGHNGAGKTTTISMLTGFLEPTSGDAIVNGYNIKSDIAKVRKNLGLCPQHNILFDLLTVEEHLEFFARLKGASRSSVGKEVDDMVKVLGLEHKRKALSHTLSGGQKRKLSVGIALIAGSKIVILDEPTSGMDPAARRQTWEILQKYRNGRTIILTTHFMDEADILGDRIAIMADGGVKCCGTSMFLKKLYGAGYHMVMVKSMNCNVQRLTDVIQSHIPSATKESEISAEISFLLPFHESPKFEKLFQEIETRMTDLGISSFGTSATTMEEVFLRPRGETLASTTTTSTLTDNVAVLTGAFQILSQNTFSDSPLNLRYYVAATPKVPATTGSILNGVTLSVGESTGDEDNDIPPPEVKGVSNPAFSGQEKTKMAFVSKEEEHRMGSNGTMSDNHSLSATKLPPISGENGVAAKQSYTIMDDPDRAQYTSIRPARLAPIDPTLMGDKSKTSVFTLDQSDQPAATTNHTSYNEGIKKNSGLSLIMQQFYGMFVKKFIQSRRNKATAATQILLPVIFTIMALSVEKALPEVGDEPALALNLGPFDDSVSGYSGGATSTASSTYFASNYSTVIKSGTTELIDRSTFASMDDYFIDAQGKVGISTFNRRYIVAGDYDESGGVTTATAHYNGQPYHSPAISLQYSMAGVLRKLKDSSYDITVTNYPLPKNINDNFRRLFYSTNGAGFTIAVSILFGMAFMSASFIIFLIREKSVGAKHLQAVSGVGPTAFWLSSFLWDMINVLIPTLVIMIVFAAFQTEAYTNNNRLGLVFIIFMLYGWSVLPFTYLLHYLFTTPATGMVVVSFINLLTGLVFILATYTLSIPALNTVEIGEALEWAFIVFFPNYNLGLSLMDMYTNAGYNDICESYNYKVTCLVQANPCCFPDNCGEKGRCFTFYENFLNWEKPGIGRECFFMALQGFVYMALVLLAEAGIFRSIMNMFVSSGAPVGATDVMSLQTQEDSDVAAEKKRINDEPTEKLMHTDSLLLKNVNKVYGSGFYAVKNVSIGIPKNKCFGLLGQNGAGKTSTFKMLTGDEPLTSGEAFLNRYSVKSNIKQVQQNLGYCPQFDALIDQMTGRETLYMYARLRGIQESQIENVVNKLIQIMMLSKHADKQTGFYSGGNKRKLSTAIALIGDPPFIFLDEPTTGVDPRARRQLWNILSDVRASGRTLVLTSHSMEECEALCTRIVIMVNGKFMCYGSTQHLKNKFGHGYTLFCRMALDNNGMARPSDPLKEFILTRFPNTQVFDDNQGYVDFQIPEESAKLAQIFGVMEKAKVEFFVEDYSVHQTTLEQIFLTFTQNQTTPREMKKNKCKGPCCCFR